MNYWLCPFSWVDSFHNVHYHANKFTQILLSNFRKNMIKPPLISLVYLTLWVNFQITLGLTRTNDCVPLLNILPINLQQCHNLSHWVDIESISSFDIKCKNLMWKISKNVFSGHLGEWVFYIFLTLHSIMGVVPFSIFIDHVRIISSSPMQHLRWSSLSQKNGNSWELVLTVVAESFVLNVTGVLDPTLKSIDKFRLRQ